MIKFGVLTPMGFHVRTTESYWSLLLTKHPEIAGRESDVQETLQKPDRVCRSRHDDRVHLFYRRDEGYHLCVVAEGEHVWPTSG